MNAEQLHAAGVQSLLNGDPQKAINLFAQAIAANPKAKGPHGDLAKIYAAKGRYADAYVALKKEIENDPNDMVTLYNFGSMAMQLKKNDEAITAFKNCLALEPGNAPVLNNLCSLYMNKGDTNSALNLIDMAVKANPTSYVSWNNYYVILKELGRTEDALEKLERAHAINSNDVDVLINLGNLCLELDRLEEAELYLRKSIEAGKKEKRTDGYNILAHLYKTTGRKEEAIALLEESKAHNSTFFGTFNELGNIYVDCGRYKEAEENFKKAIKLAPNDAGVRSNYSMLYWSLGKLNEAEKILRDGLKLDSNSISVRKNLLMLSTYKDYDANEAWRDIEEFNNYSKQFYVKRDFKNTLELNRKIRIGYITSDFRSQPVGRNMLPVFMAHDKSKFEIYSYVDLPQMDDMSEAFKSLSDKWTNINPMTDEQVAKAIQDDEIDILVSTALRFDQNKNVVMAMKPAPITVSIHDTASSGIDSMDYLISDITLVPKNTKEKFYERVLHIPSFYTHMSMNVDVSITESPMKKNGFVTFGSCNNPAKITEKTIDTWSKVLNALPDSRMLFKYRQTFNSTEIRNVIINRFLRNGITEDRLIFKTGDNHSTQTHMDVYNEIDISLDTSPFTGSTTTFESLWMGVPVITVSGETMVQRWSHTILRTINKEEWVARNDDEFVEIVKRLASAEVLSNLRETLRFTVMGSSLNGSDKQAKQLERLYTAMWGKYCKERK